MKKEKHFLIVLLVILIGVMTSSCTANNNTEEIYKAIKDFTIVLSEQKSVSEIVNPSGIEVIRNFISGGFGVRGKNVRDHYSLESVPVNLEFPVKGEIEIDPKNLFAETININIKDIPLLTTDGVMFKFENENIPSTSKVIEICQKIGTKYSDDSISPKIIKLNDKEIVLTESVVIDDLPLGAWAVFERIDNKYLLRALIDLR